MPSADSQVSTERTRTSLTPAPISSSISTSPRSVPAVAIVPFGPAMSSDSTRA